MNRLRFSFLSTVLVAYFGPGSAAAADVPLSAGSVLRFATPREGIAAITRRDDYITRLSRFDLEARLKTDRDVSEQDFLAFISSHVQPWQDEDVRKLMPFIESLRAKIEPWKLDLPPIVLLVKTSGQEEAGAAYCRGPAIVLPQNMLHSARDKLEKILPHELFHVLSSHNLQLREALYETIGFKACNEVQLPGPLRSRKITNPDAPVNDHYLTAHLNGETIELMPVLLSKAEHYDVQRGGTLFSYLDFKLMLLDNASGMRRPALRDGRAVLLDPASVPEFLGQVGRNTAYTIHPEEILADNFVFLLDGRINLPTPRIVEQMGKVLQARAPR